MDVLFKVMFETFGGKLQLSCTNLAVEQKLSFPVSVQKENSFAVSAKNIYELVKSMYSDNVEFILDEEKYWVNFKSGKVKGRLAASSIDEFPEFSTIDVEETTPIPSEKLKLLIDMTYFSICKDEGRPHLNSMLLEMEDEVLTGVGTDGHRLSKYSLSLEGIPTLRFLLPEKGLGVLKSLVGTRGEEIKIGKSSNKIFVQREVSLGKAEGEMIEQMMDISLVIREPEARFPPYDKVIPKSFEKSCKVSQNVFYEALKRAMFIAKSGEQNYIALQFTNGEDLKISGDDLSIGGINDVINVEFDHSEEFTIGFNGSYLLEFVGALSDSKELLLYFNEDTDACKITSPDEAEYYTGIVMPVRI